MQRAGLFVLTLLRTERPGDCFVLRDVGDVPPWVVLLFAVGAVSCVGAGTRPSSSSPSCRPRGR